MKRLSSLFLMVAVFVPALAYAGGVGSFLNQLGTMYRSNLSVSPTTYYMSDQTAYTTMGSLSLRSPNQNNDLLLFNITAPSFHAGCDGIDLNTGGLYFVQDPKMLVDRLTSYGTSVIYGMVVSLASSLPVIGDALKWIEGVQEKFNKFLRDGCKHGQMLMKGDVPTELASWFNNEDEKKKIATGSPADKAHEEAKKTAPVIPFNLVYVNMEGHSRNAARLMMSLMGTVIVKPNVTNAENPDKDPYSALFSVEEYITGELKNNGHNFEWQCSPAGDVTVPKYDPQANPQPCINLVKVQAVNANQKSVKEEYEDLIMAVIYLARYAGAGANPGAITTGGGKPLSYYMHGRTLGELQGTMLMAGAALPRLLKIAAMQHDPAKIKGWEALYNQYAVPLAPVVAIHYIRYLVSDLMESASESFNSFAASVPPSTQQAFRARARDIISQTYHFERTVQAQLEGSMMAAKQYRAAMEELNRVARSKTRNTNDSGQ